MPNFWLYLLTMAGITYLIRMLPLVLIKKKIKNKFVLSFLYYIPYAVLSVMTIPAIFTSTTYVLAAVAGFAVAMLLSYFEKSLVTKTKRSTCFRASRFIDCAAIKLYTAFKLFPARTNHFHTFFRFFNPWNRAVQPRGRCRYDSYGGTCRFRFNKI